MSVTKVMDVFCDRCACWVHAGVEITRARAWQIARDVHGWKKQQGEMVCPTCLQEEKEEENL